MLIRTFKAGYLINIILFIIISLLLWLHAFIEPQPMIVENNYGLIYHYLNFMALLPAHLVTVVAFGFVLLQAIMLNAVVADNPVFSRSTYLPALVYVILMSYLQRQQTIHPVLIANFFLILSLKNLSKIYGKTDDFKESFNASFWIAVASMIQFPLVLLMFFVWFSFIIYRLSKWREWVISILGFIAPYIFLLSIFFLTDELGQFVSFAEAQWNSFSRVSIRFDGELLLFWALFLLLMLIAFLKLAIERGEKLISIRKRFNVLVVMFLSCLAIGLGGGSNPIDQLPLLFPSSALVISYYFIEARRVFYAELFFSLLLIIIFTSRFV